MFDSSKLVRIPLEEVPPPSVAPRSQAGDRLGLVAGLYPEVMDHACRCYWCRKMQPAGATMVSIPDQVSAGDPAWAVTEACRRSAFNGNFSMICLDCAPRRPGYVRPGGWRDFLLFLIGRGNV